jgi:acid phosphatase family membrane protein YuiD
MKRFTIAILCIISCINISAQSDSVRVFLGNRKEIILPVERKISCREFNLNRLHHSFSLAVPVGLVGLAIMPADDAINRGINGGGHNFSSSVDEYLRFAPLAAQLGMGLGGVKGRSESKWQLLATDALATTMMVAMTGGLKYSINRTRPDGDDGGFPSGHTATAFMGATLLAHEYGHISGWIPAAGYTMATATGVLRILNNRHYASDVLVGAAIGILSAELAYWATDAIFNKRKLFKPKRARIHYEVLKNY